MNISTESSTRRRWRRTIAHLKNKSTPAIWPKSASFMKITFSVVPSAQNLRARPSRALVKSANANCVKPSRIGERPSTNCLSLKAGSHQAGPYRRGGQTLHPKPGTSASALRRVGNRVCSDRHARTRKEAFSLRPAVFPSGVHSRVSDIKRRRDQSSTNAQPMTTQRRPPSAPRPNDRLPDCPHHQRELSSHPEAPDPGSPSLGAQ